jgi:hypothetical protein
MHGPLPPNRGADRPHEGSIRGDNVSWGAIFLDDELALGKCPFQEGIIRDRA